MLVLPNELAERLQHLGEEAYPQEACGLVVGVATGSRREARAVVAVRNAASGTRDRFEQDPGELAAAACEARDAGLEVLATWHSHPDAPPVPSAADLAGADPGWAQVIVPVGGPSPRAGGLACWTIDRVGPSRVARALELG